MSEAIANLRHKPWVVMMLYISLFVLLMSLSQHGFSAETEGGGLPYEAWLDKLRKSITGPVAFSLSVIGIVIAGVALIFGGEIGGFFKTMIFVVLVMSMIVSAQNMVTTFFGTGAELSQYAHETVHLNSV
jgi:type IV secretory pathway VirB2 component (pilin)